MLTLLVSLCLLQPEPVQKFPPFYLPTDPNEEDKYPDFPPLVCINPFTDYYSHEDAKIQLDRHTRHMSYLEKIYAKQPNDIQIGQWVLETADRYAKWEHLEKILNPSSTECLKRTELHGLKIALKDYDFHRGIMPTPFGYAEYPQ